MSETVRGGTAGPMRILGIDPGLVNTGFAVIDHDGPRMAPLWYDCLTTKSSEAMADRLHRIARACRDALAHWRPEAVAIESLFFGASAPAALAVGQARGVCMLACAEAGVEVFEYAPAMVKQAVTGYGRADKRQVQEMVKHILAMSVVPSPDHCADAFAIAITHAGSRVYVPANAPERAR